MKLSSLVIACAVAFGGTAAFAANDTSSGSSASSTESHGTSLVDKAKAEMHKLGEVTRKAAHKVAGKDKKSGDPTDTSSMGASGASSDSGSGSSASGSGSSTDTGSSSGSSTHGKKTQRH